MNRRMRTRMSGGVRGGGLPPPPAVEDGVPVEGFTFSEPITLIIGYDLTDLLSHYRVGIVDAASLGWTQ